MSNTGYRYLLSLSARLSNRDRARLCQKIGVPDVVMLFLFVHISCISQSCCVVLRYEICIYVYSDVVFRCFIIFFHIFYFALLA